MDKSKWIKLALSAAGLVLTAAGTVFSDKVKDAKMEETVTKKVAEALAAHAEES